jgi:hypothetical protein
MTDAPNIANAPTVPGRRRKVRFAHCQYTPPAALAHDHG